MRRETILGTAAILFGLLTLRAGGSVLFGPPDVRAAAGDIVPLVLWFNTASGVFYVAAGAGILLRKAWGLTLARIIAAAIGAVLTILVVLILAGTPWEMRTLAAMIVRAAFWVGIVIALRGRPWR